MVKLINSLQLKKNRIALKLMVIEGEKLILEAVKRKVEIKNLFILQEVLDNHQISFNNINYTVVNNTQLQQISNFKNNNFGVALIPIQDNVLDFNDLAIGKLLILDGINDPGNLGTIIRTADWYGVKNIVCSEDCVDVTNPKVVQSTMGSIFNVKVFYQNLQTVFENLEQIPDYKIYASVLNGENFREVNPIKNGALIMGSESHGIKNFPQKYIPITIPKSTETYAESLNVAMACAILSERIWQH